MTPKTYRRKPVDVEAFQFVRYPNGHTSGEELAAWCGGTYHAETLGSTGVVGYWVTLPSEEDEPYNEAQLTNFVVRDAAGAFRVLSEDTFRDEYEATS